MFPVEAQYTGAAIDQNYVTKRARWEPLYEATQIKGDGETHPFLSPDDAFADYETWDAGNLDLSQAKTPEMLQYEYARQALRNGLALEAKLGTNPYKFGWSVRPTPTRRCRPPKRTTTSARRRTPSPSPNG
jgi:hypothetical protein